jgi:putative alpha-1,2-mannosidase
MGAWYVFANIGLYPETPGVGGFSINGPSFPHIKIHLSNGTVDVTGGSENKYYIKSLQLNGRVYNNTWLPWERIQDGARLNFKLTKQPNKNWGISDPPPSFE